MRTPPACADGFLATLRAARLLDEPSLARLAASWDDGPSPADCAERLVAAGLLTSFQARYLLAGKPCRLRIGPYRLLSRLGAGGGGIVYKAEHVLLKRLVALKIMKRRGRDEVRAVARLAHPNIVSAYDARRWRGRTVLAMEYADGMDLGRLVREGGPLPIPMVMEIARQTALALGHLHRRGLVHRDVKPANLILVSGGEGGAVLAKLLDLGLAGRAGGPDDSMHGTADYLAPERGDGEPLDIRSDLYSLGCTLFLLLTGQLPHSGDTVANRLLSRKLDDPTPVRSLRPEVPLAVEALIGSLLAREPERRPADPDAVVALLDAAMAVPPAVPLPPRKKKPPARRLRLLASILLGVVAGGLARLALEAPAPAPAASIRAARSFLTVSGMKAEFTTLQGALAAAPAGGVVTLHGDGPFRADGLTVVGPLTLEAAPGGRPRLEAGPSGWEPMLSGDLSLVGLTLWGGPGPAPLVESRGRLSLVRCSLRGTREGALVSLRQGRSLRLEDCRLDAAFQAISVEPPDGGACVASLERSDLHVRTASGVAMLAWRGKAGRSARLALSLSGGSVRAGRVLALRHAAADAVVKRSHLAFSQALASIDGPGREALRWQADGASMEGPAAQVRVNGRGQPMESLAAAR